MRGGSLTRFRPDEYYDQDGKGMLAFPIIDFTPPLPKRCVQEYYRQFFYQPMGAQCYVDGCHCPLMSKSYWVEKDKKVNPHSPPLMYLAPWPPSEKEEEEENVVVT